MIHVFDPKNQIAYVEQIKAALPLPEEGNPYQASLYHTLNNWLDREALAAEHLQRMPMVTGVVTEDNNA